MSAPTLYDRLGGAAVLDSLIPAFYTRVMADAELAPFFRHTSLEALHEMQRQFFTMALGGPMTYTGRSLSAAHHGRGITSGHFSRFVGHLLETLRDLGVSEPEADEVIARIDTYANEITGTSY